MDNKIIELKSTSFAGKRFTRKQLHEIQITVGTMSAFSRSEIANTICENLNWRTHKGEYKKSACLSALEKMEKQYLLCLPKKRMQKKSVSKKILWSDRTKEEAQTNLSLRELGEISLEKVFKKEDISLWNEYIDRYHYMGYKKPFASRLRYFVTSQVNGNKTILGCLLFSPSAWRLSSRDSLIGWTEKDRKKRLNLVVSNSRFLIFPWIKVQNLASKILSMMTIQIVDDWHTETGHRPVLLESFINPEKFHGSCYKAANWQYLGKTAGRHRDDRLKLSEAQKKDIYIFPLRKDFKAILKNEKQKTQKPSPSERENDHLIHMWTKITVLITQITEEYDLIWQKRSRVINTMLIVLFIFRLLFSKNKQSYKLTLSELWGQCLKMDVELPQASPVAPSAMCKARTKLDENIFKKLNTKIIECYRVNDSRYSWKNRRLFAVDGSKVNLPLKLKKVGYKTSCDHGNYPQGLMSCLYQLKSQIPYEFELSKDKDERALAKAHLKVLKEDDVIVFDRGYFSYAMLYFCVQKKVDVIFRLGVNTLKEITCFIKSDETDKVLNLQLNKYQQKRANKKYPELGSDVIKLRLVKYTQGGTTYTLGTTLMDKDLYTLKDLSDVYHSRWGIEELYKISKEFINVEDFHAQTERGVKQELFSHFVLITMNRIFSNHTEKLLKQKDRGKKSSLERAKVNFKSCLTVFSRTMEGLILQHNKIIKETVNFFINTISTYKQRVRSNRSYKRQSLKPLNKWTKSKSKKKKGKKKASTETSDETNQCTM